MTKTTIKLPALVMPILFIGVLQLTGCWQRSIPNPNPGGIYLSTNGGASFEQSVRLVDDQGELTGYLDQESFRAIVRPSHLPQTIYATTFGATVVFSPDNGHTWQRVNHPLPGSMSLVRLNNDVILLAGTNAAGEGVVIRSLDLGGSWSTVLSIPGPAKQPRRLFQIIKPPPPPPVFVSSLVADHFSPDRVYVTTSTGDVLVGEESGKTWRTLTRVTTKVDPVTGYANAPIRQVIPSPHRPEEIILVTTTNQLIRVDHGEPTALAKPDPTLLQIGYTNHSPDTLLASTVKGAFISRDRGASWQDMELPISKTSPIQNTVIHISPTNPARFLAGIDNIIYRSEDNAVSWHTFSLGLPNHYITDLSIDPVNAANVVLLTAPKPS